MENRKPKARVLALYLPQFHPIPENDEWWGKGFTEWTNVGKAKPLFPWHYQPHVPADLGYYDLRVPETRKAQADMAREYGIEGFIYYHYWFAGHELMERPLHEVVASAEPDYPFCICWANQTWQGFNFGVNNERNVLIEQTYPGDEDHIIHFQSVLPALKDKRYIQCEGKPMFFLYMADRIPDLKHFTELWNRMAKEHGLQGIYFTAIFAGYYTEKEARDYRLKMMNSGVNAVTYIRLHTQKDSGFVLWKNRLYKYILRIPNIYSYKKMMAQFIGAEDREYNGFPSIITGWDHTPRSGKRGMVYNGYTPNLLEQHAKLVVNEVQHKPLDKRIVVVKSWNEWAEGNYLEPDIKWGKQFLEAIKRAIYE